MAAAAEWLMRERPDLYIIGWYHSHPGFDLFLSTIDIETQKRYQMMFPKAIAMVVDPMEYAKTRRLKDLRFKVFRISKRGTVVSLRVTIGIHRRKVIESTLQGMETVDLRFIRRAPKEVEETEISGEAFETASLGSVFERIRKRFSPR